MTGYDLVQVLTEYHILRRLIVDLLVETSKFTHEERRMVNEAIDRGIAHAGQKFLDVWKKRGQESIDRLIEEKLLRERFIQTLSHDLRNPMTAIQMNIELALKKIEPGSAASKPLASAINALNHMHKMIRDLLDVGQAQVGTIPVNLVRTEIEALIKQTLEDMLTQFGNRFVLSSTCLYLDCDPLAIRRVLENLISNAVKYGKQESLIKISVADQGEWISLTVFNEER